MTKLCFSASNLPVNELAYSVQKGTLHKFAQQVTTVLDHLLQAAEPAYKVMNTFVTGSANFMCDATKHHRERSMFMHFG